MISSLTASVLAYIAPVQWIVDLLKPILVFFHDSIGVGWGMSIVLLTVCVRAALAPLTVKQFKSMQAMVRVAPELKALQGKYKDDKQRQQQEVMKFYAEHKINPFASCLPLLAQMPFFIGLFYLLQSDLRREICGRGIQAVGELVECGKIPNPTGAEEFLFIPDLTAVPSGWVLAVLVVLYISSQLLSSLLTPSTADRMQRMIMYGLPFVFVIFVINFPAGLIVYWITTNLWTVGQGYILRKRMGPITPPADATPALAGLGKGASTVPAGGGFMARLAAMTGSAAQKGSEDGEQAAKAGSRGSTAAKARTPAPAGAAASGAAKAGAGGGKGASRASRSAKSAGATAEPAAKPARTGPPPPPPRKKKKRSGRRR